MVNSNHNGSGTRRDVQLEQELSGLRRQYEQLRDHKVRTEQQVADLTGRLESLKEQSMAQYGTSDPEELQSLLNEKRLENERVVAEYREHIQQIQADLAAVESRVDGE